MKFELLYHNNFKRF